MNLTEHPELCICQCPLEAHEMTKKVNIRLPWWGTPRGSLVEAVVCKSTVTSGEASYPCPCGWFPAWDDHMSGESIPARQIKETL